MQLTIVLAAFEPPPSTQAFNKIWDIARNTQSGVFLVAPRSAPRSMPNAMMYLLPLSRTGGS